MLEIPGPHRHRERRTCPVNTRDFDALTRHFFTATNRRSVFSGLAGLLAVLIGVPDQIGTAAQRKRKSKRRRCRALGQRCKPGQHPGCCGKTQCRGGRCRCGKKQKACHGKCIGKKRRCNCPAGQTQCGPRCANLKTAKGHCGSCGNACSGTATCQNGVCVGGSAYRMVQAVQGQDGALTLRPYAITLDKTGSIYVTDSPDPPSSPGRVWKFTRNGVLSDVWTHVGTFPVGIGFNSDNVAYVADLTGDMVLTFTRYGTKLPLEIDVPLGPNTLAVGPNGDVYVAAESVVRQFDSDGDFLLQWGSFGFAAGVATAPDGDVYVVDADAGKVSRWSSEGEFVEEWVGPGTGFQEAGAIAVDGAGFVYVVDSGTNTILKFTATGGYIGTFGQDANFGFAEYIVVTETGTVWVTDLTGEKIVQFEPA